jgi:hypothetical protein
VGDRFELGGFSLERCRRQIWIGRVVVEELWATGLNRESYCWRDVGDRFRSGELTLERCGRQVRVGRVFVGEM